MSSQPSYEYHRVTRGLGLRLVGTRTSQTTPLETELKLYQDSDNQSIQYHWLICFLIGCGRELVSAEICPENR